MNKDRIQIDGVWYVREDQTKKEEVDITYYIGAVCEDEYTCFDFNIMSDENTSKLGYLSVKYTDKTVNPFKDHYWDNEVWFNGLLENNPESFRELDDLKISSQVMSLTMLKKLKEEGWF